MNKQPFPKLRFPRRDGEVTVEALGTALPAPGIQILKDSLTLTGRNKIECVEFEPEEIPRLIQYLQDALVHWQTC